MRKTTLLLLGTLCISSGYSQAPKAKARAKQSPVLEEITDDPSLPRVLLIGDSISMGYTLPTRKLLAGKANVHRIPANGGPTIRGIEEISKWIGSGKWDVIHFNWGLHDLRFMDDGKRQVPLEDYEKNLRQLVAQLRATGARLIWASTTPVPSGKLSPTRTNEDVIAYNAAAKKIMDENRIPTDELYALVLPQEEKIQLPSNVHFTPEGYQVLAEQVAASIKRALRTGPANQDLKMLF